MNVFPDELKKAKVVPIPKTKDLTDVNNYRPISLLSVLSKPIERHIHKHTLQYLESHNLLYPLQSGFRPNHSCHTALTSLVDTWLSAMNKTEMSGAVFIDLKKAFDMVNHSILLNKLGMYLCHNSATLQSTTDIAKVQNQETPSVIKLFKSYLTDRQQKVVVNGSSSSWGALTRGVPQGSVLGPLLFCIFINDLPLQLNKENISCDLFADDATIHTQGRDINAINKNLQTGLNEVTSWCDENSMVLNPKKTESMIIANQQMHQRGPFSLDLTVKEQTVVQVEDHKLLGVTIDSKLKWKYHIHKVCNKIARNIYLLSKLKPFVDTNTRKLFYNAKIRPHIDYSSTLWDKTSEAHIKRLNSLQRRAAKIILPDGKLTTDEKLDKLKILPLTKHLLYNKGILMYKIWKRDVPRYLSDLFKRQQSKYSSSKKNFRLPLPQRDIFKSSLSFSGASLWNNLPTSVKDTDILSTFKENLHEHLSKQ